MSQVLHNKSYFNIIYMHALLAYYYVLFGLNLRFIDFNYFTGMDPVQNFLHDEQDYLRDDSDSDKDHEISTLKADVATRDMTILELKGKIIVFERTIESLSHSFNKLSVIPAPAHSRFTLINEESKYLLSAISSFPCMKNIMMEDKMPVEDLMLALDTLLHQWSSALTFQDMLPPTFSTSTFELSRCRPCYTFKNFQSVFDATSGRTLEAKFVELIAKFDQRLVTYRHHMTFLGRNFVFETVLHGYVGSIVCIMLFHMYDNFNATLRYGLNSPPVVDYYDASQYAECVVAVNQRELAMGLPSSTFTDQHENILDLGQQRNSYSKKRKKFHH